MGSAGIGLRRHNCIHIYDGPLGLHELLLTIHFSRAIHFNCYFFVFPNEAQRCQSSSAQL